MTAQVYPKRFPKTHPFIEITPISNEYNYFYISSGDYEDGDSKPQCTLTIGIFGKYITINLPAIIKPKKTKVIARWDAATVARLGRDYYYHYDRRNYGFSLYDGHVSIMDGVQTDDSSTTKGIGFFLPWTQMTFLRRTIFDCDGKFYANFPDFPKLKRHKWEEEHQATETVKKVSFVFADYDGETIIAKCFIEEREWSHGEKWCSWLKYFKKNKVRRSMDIAFSSQMGRKKGSWKGGTLGHGIDMLPNETCIEAFKRYCIKENLIFKNKIDDLI